MSDTLANQWVPVSERLPEPTVHKQILWSDGSQAVAFIGGCSGKWTIPCVGIVDSVTHWMDLPEPPAPPKPADPFEAWWDQNCNTFCCSQNDLRRAWNAAKEHYAKLLPDFETWAKAHCADGPYLEVEKGGRLINERAARIVWNAAQGKPEA